MRQEVTKNMKNLVPTAQNQSRKLECEVTALKRKAVADNVAIQARAEKRVKTAQNEYAAASRTSGTEASMFRRRKGGLPKAIGY